VLLFVDVVYRPDSMFTVMRLHFVFYGSSIFSMRCSAVESRRGCVWSQENDEMVFGVGVWVVGGSVRGLPEKLVCMGEIDVGNEHR
jgi:hypothetical protein